MDYDEELWTRISEGLNRPNFDGIHVINRAQIVDDLLNLAKIDAHKYSFVLDIISFLKNDVDYFPWYSAFTAFSHMWQRTGTPTIRTLLSVGLLSILDCLKHEIFLGTHPRTYAKTLRERSLRIG